MGARLPRPRSRGCAPDLVQLEEWHPVGKLGQRHVVKLPMRGVLVAASVSGAMLQRCAVAERLEGRGDLQRNVGWQRRQLAAA